jgi:hypothetical protein
MSTKKENLSKERGFKLFFKVMQIGILRFGLPMFVFYFIMMAFFGALDEGMYTVSELLFFCFQLGVYSGILFGLIMWLFLVLKKNKK